MGEGEGNSCTYSESGHVDNCMLTVQGWKVHDSVLFLIKEKKPKLIYLEIICFNSKGGPALNILSFG